MKVIIYMAITPNGFIAKSDDDTSWISGDEWDSYSAVTRAAGNLIVGHRTYDILTKQPEFVEFKDVKLVVVTEHGVELVDPRHVTVRTPEEALAEFAEDDVVIVAGGGALNASFLAENLVDEIYLDIEPLLFAKGIPLFHSADFERSLKLLGTKQITENEIQLHYAVIK